MTNKDPQYVSRAETIQEIAIRNEMPVSAVRLIYNHFSLKYHSRDLSGIITPNPVLREKIFRSTEKYIDRQRIKELNKLKSALDEVKITKSLADIARKNKASYLAVIDIYNQFNDRVYSDELDEKALKLTGKYFGIMEAKELRKIKS